VICYIGVLLKSKIVIVTGVIWPAALGRRERCELRAACGEAARRTPRPVLLASQQGVRPPTAKAPLTAECPNVERLRLLSISRRPAPCGRFPEGPRTKFPPRVYSVCQHFSAPAHSTRGGQIVCGVLPAISTFQRHSHSTQHPSFGGRLPVSTCYCRRPSLPVVFDVLGVALAA
jgi:hypothetical protein